MWNTLFVKIKDQIEVDKCDRCSIQFYPSPVNDNLNQFCETYSFVKKVYMKIDECVCFSIQFHRSPVNVLEGAWVREARCSYSYSSACWWHVHTNKWACFSSCLYAGPVVWKKKYEVYYCCLRAYLWHALFEALRRVLGRLN